jgi:hypothetical protein
VLGRVVVEQGDREIGAGRVAEHRGDELHATLAGAGTMTRGVARRGSQAALEHEAPRVAQAGHEQQRQQGADDRDAEGDQGARHEAVDQHQSHRGHEHGAHEVQHLVEAAEPVPTQVQPAGDAADQLQGRRDEDGTQQAGEPEVAPLVGVEGELVAQHHREGEPDRPREDVARELERQAVFLERTPEAAEEAPASRRFGCGWIATVRHRLHSSWGGPTGSSCRPPTTPAS